MAIITSLPSFFLPFLNHLETLGMELADRIPLIILTPNTHLFRGAFKGHHYERFYTHTSTTSKSKQRTKTKCQQSHP